MSESPKPTHRPDDVSVAYQLRCHFGFPTYRRQPKFTDELIPVASEALQRIANQNELHLLEFAFLPHVLRCLVSLRSIDAPERVARTIKGNFTAALRPHGVAELWSRGTFVRSNGNVDDATISSYLAKQWGHHRDVPERNPDFVIPCHYESGLDPSELRHSSHCVFQYNVHFVFSVSRRARVLDPTISKNLIEYWRRLCESRGWMVWSIACVGDHAHMMLGLGLGDSPMDVALSLMNNSEYVFQKQNMSLFKEFGLDSLWSRGFYAGTVGAATTEQIARYLENQRDLA